MAFTDRLTTSISAGGVTLRQTKTFESTGRAGFSETIAAGATDVAVSVAIDISALVYLALQSDQAVTIKTNSTSVPDDTLALAAGDLVIYDSGKAALFPLFLTADVTTMYISNPGATDAVVELVGLQDATP